MSDQQLLDLHDSLGITAEDESNTRFEAIHMYGTHDMSTQDVFEYFGKYGPASIEWINDESCNVVWLDKVSAVRAFHGLSSPISGMPVTGKCDAFKEDIEKQEQEEGESESQGRSILLVSKNREVELYDENEDKAMDEDEDKENGAVKKSEGTIHVSEIGIPVPPGYWRLGISHPKSKYVLLRFAKRTDRKPFRAERFSQYYKKYGNPNYGGIKGLISQSKKLRMKAVNHPDVDTEDLDEPETIESGNPWGSLAKNWNFDVREHVPEISTNVPSHSKPSKSILDRLGSTNKRVHVASVNDDVDDEKESDKEEIVAKKSKVPRMRMYADEEEARVEKVKQLKKLRQLEEIEEIISENEFWNIMPDLRNTVPDLRNTRIDIRHSVPEVRTIRTDLRNAVSDKRNTRTEIRNEMPDLRNRIRKQAGTTTNSSSKTFHADKISDIVSSGRIIKQEIRRPTRHSESDNSDNDDDVNVQQKSKVTVIVKKPNAMVKPTVASTIWARLDKEKEQQKQKLQLAKKNESQSESSESSAVASDAESNSDNDKNEARNKFSKALNHRPGFNRDLKSRLGLSSEHKSPLRIEINNDHYKKS